MKEELYLFKVYQHIKIQLIAFLKTILLKIMEELFVLIYNQYIKIQQIAVFHTISLINLVGQSSYTVNLCIKNPNTAIFQTILLVIQAERFILLANLPTWILWIAVLLVIPLVQVGLSWFLIYQSTKILQIVYFRIITPVVLVEHYIFM